MADRGDSPHRRFLLGCRADTDCASRSSPYESASRCGRRCSALEYLRREGIRLRRPAIRLVILLDLRMPRMDGLELFYARSADTNLKHLRVVVLSMSRDDPDLARRNGWASMRIW